MLCWDRVVLFTGLLLIGLQRARLKPKATSAILVCHMGWSGPDAWDVTCCLPGCALIGSWHQERYLGLELTQSHHPGYRPPNWWLNYWVNRHKPSFFCGYVNLPSNLFTLVFSQCGNMYVVYIIIYLSIIVQFIELLYFCMVPFKIPNLFFIVSCF